jgi:Leucine-rich repeat
VQFENLVLDEMPIGQLTELDRNFMESFTAMEQLSMNQCELSSLANLPRSDKIYRIELSENKITGDQLHHLHQYAGTLSTLKLATNNLASYEDVKALSGLTLLKNLDLEQNAVTKLSDYKQYMFRMLPSL